MTLTLWEGKFLIFMGTKITVGSLITWFLGMSDFYSDIVYYLTVPKSNDLLQYVMLISLILPHVLNLLWLSWKITLHEEDWCTGIYYGLAYTVSGLLGVHDLVVFVGLGTMDKMHIERFDIIRGNNAGFEDCVQFVAQSHNSYTIGKSFTAVMLISPLLSIHGITTKFQSKRICGLKNEYFDGKIVVEYSKNMRIFKCLQVMVMTYGALIGTVVSCFYTFFLHDQQYAWFASRVWLARPQIFTEDVISQLWIGLYVVVGLIVLALCYFGITKCSEEKNENQVTPKGGNEIEV